MTPPRRRFAPPPQGGSASGPAKPAPRLPLDWAGALRRALALAGGALALLSMAAQAAPMPNATRTVSLTAREQPVAAFLQNFFSAVDVPASLSPQLAGNVNGTFSGPADRVMRDVARIYNLVGYYDGNVMHVVSAAELVTKNYT